MDKSEQTIGIPSGFVQVIASVASVSGSSSGLIQKILSLSFPYCTVLVAGHKRKTGYYWGVVRFNLFGYYRVAGLEREVTMDGTKQAASTVSLLRSDRNRVIVQT